MGSSCHRLASGVLLVLEVTVMTCSHSKLVLQFDHLGAGKTASVQQCSVITNSGVRHVFCVLIGRA